MRCGCFVLNDKTPKGRKRHKVLSWWHTSDLGPVGDPKITSESLLAEGYKVCEGKIAVKGTAEDEPYYGGCSAVFSIDYVCEECGWQFYPHLPQTSEALGAMVTDLIAATTPEAEATMIAAARDSELASIAHRNQMMADFHARQELARKQKAEKKAKKKVSA